MIKGWKTLVFGAVLAALGTIQAADLAVIVPAGWEGTVMAAIGVIVVYLRSITTTAITKSE